MKRLRRAYQKSTGTNRPLTRRIVTVSTAAAVSLAGSAHLAKSAVSVGDKHRLLVAVDADRDSLSDQEEYAVGYQPFNADQNGNGVPDGIELAIRGATVISQLPSAADANDPSRTYKIESPLRGIELCDICGEPINMGTVRLVNPRLRLDVEFPIIAVHYLEHGSFSYAGELHQGRLNVPMLLRAMEVRFPYEPDRHQLSLDATGQIARDANDLDGDLLADSEELTLGLNLYDADQNENLLPDGIELAQRFAEMIERLPTLESNSPTAKGVYKVSFMQKGLEWCDICGESVNMGYWKLVNSTLGLSLDVPVIICHYMQHGSFSFSGSVHGASRANVAKLKEILNFPAMCGDLGIPYQPADLNRDCRVDFEDLAEMASRWLSTTDAAGGQQGPK